MTERDRRILEGARAHLQPNSGSSEGEKTAARSIINRLERLPPRQYRANAYDAQARAAQAQSLNDNTRAIPGWPANTLLRTIVIAQGNITFPPAEYSEAKQQHERMIWLAPASVATMMENHDRVATAQLNAYDAEQLRRLRTELLLARPYGGLVLPTGYRLWLDFALRQHGLDGAS